MKCDGSLDLGSVRIILNRLVTRIFINIGRRRLPTSPSARRSWAFPRTTPARLTSPGHDCLVSSLSILSSRSFVKFGPGRVCGRNRPWKEETVAAQLLVGEALKYRTTKQTLD